MTRLLAAVAALTMLASPAAAATRTVDAVRVAGSNLLPMARPIRIALRPAPLRKPRHELSRLMARNFGIIGQRQVDVLVASVQ